MMMGTCAGSTGVGVRASAVTMVCGILADTVEAGAKAKSRIEI